MSIRLMKRREAVAALGSAAAWPLAALAQQPNRMRRVGVVILYPENDPQGQLRATAFRGELEKAGWTIGGNLQINI
jgi:putative ABC transport system substrate-binding protein